MGLVWPSKHGTLSLCACSKTVGSLLRINALAEPRRNNGARYRGSWRFWLMAERFLLGSIRQKQAWRSVSFILYEVRRASSCDDRACKPAPRQDPASVTWGHRITCRAWPLPKASHALAWALGASKSNGGHSKRKKLEVAQSIFHRHDAGLMIGFQVG